MESLLQELLFPVKLKREADSSAFKSLESGLYEVITITDAGQGINPDLMSRIFDPFFTTKAPGHGTGMGLSTAQAITKRLGGNIFVSSQPDKSSKFEVCIPITDEI